MTKQAPTKKVDADFWAGRLSAARSHLNMARDALTLAKDGENMAGVVSLAVLSSIAYADSMTAKRMGRVNQQSHQAAPRVLRDALEHELPTRHERFFSRLLGQKDEAHYGARHIRREEAQAALDGLEAFARWAESVLSV